MVVARYRLNVDYTSATQGSDDGHTVFTPNVAIVGTVTTTGGLTDAQLRAAPVPISGTVTASGPQTSTEYLANNRAATGTKSTVASGVSSVPILALNASRKGATITNTDANVLYLDLSGGTATSTSFSVAIAANGYYELPSNFAVYTGLITGIWAADGTGSALVTEFS